MPDSTLRAKDRSGRDDDFKNFPAFPKKLKSALKVTGGRDGVSITLPASYWYLQHFDIQEIQKHTDFLNMMTYDFHGTWDMGNQWVGPYLNAHSNLTEIEQSLDLLWRNDINPENVVLGLAFYGRAFTVADAGCTAPGCKYASGGERLPCSGEISVALNSEIMDIMEKTGAKPTLDKDAAVQILKYGDNQWLSFDDEETLAMRVGFARKQCLGRVMTWAVSHDLPDAPFSLAVGRASKTKASYINAKLAKGDNDGYDETVDKIPQCMWTNCLDECPSGWIRMKRNDGDRSDENEFMISLQSCMGHGKRQLCCPPDKNLPDCGWYNHHNGKCKASPLPINDIEIGSTSAHCRSGYQAASCSVAFDPMRLWNTCAWSQDWPKCDSGSCKDGRTELFSSHSGSGGSDCSGKQKRKYCCDNQRDFQWGNCDWYEHAGEFPGSLPDGQCLGGCPNNKYAVSLETKGGGCSSGARAMCCENGYQTREKRMNSNDQEFDYMLSQFLPDAKCSSDADSKLGRAQTIIIKSLQRIMYSSTTAATRKVWDSRVTLQFKHLTAANLAVFAQKDGSAISVGLDVFPGRLLCAMTFYNSRLGGEVDETCECGRKPCCSNNICPRDDDEGLAGRGVYSLLVGRNASEVDDEYAFLMGLYDDDDDDHYSDISSRDVISYDWKVFSPWVGDYVSGAYKNIDFPSSGEWKSGDSVFSRAIDFISQACKDFGTITVNIITNTGFDSEHIVERQSVRSLIESTLTGELASGADSDFAPLDPVFWTTIMQEQVTDRPTVFKMKTNVSTRMDHLMNGLGSYTNTDVFALAASGLNNMKSKLWKEDVKNLVAPGTMKKLRQDTRDRASASRYINNIRKVTASLQYLNNPTVVKLLLIIIQDIKKELSLAEAVYYAANNIHLNMVVGSKTLEKHVYSFRKCS